MKCSRINTTKKKKSLDTYFNAQNYADWKWHLIPVPIFVESVHLSFNPKWGYTFHFSSGVYSLMMKLKILVKAGQHGMEKQELGWCCRLQGWNMAWGESTQAEIKLEVNWQVWQRRYLTWPSKALSFSCGHPCCSTLEMADAIWALEKWWDGFGAGYKRGDGKEALTVRQEGQIMDKG